MIQEPITIEPSILNRHHTALKGPQLLHDLVQLDPPETQLAVDFLEDGSRRRKLSYKSLHNLSDGLAGEIRKASSGLKDASVIVPVFLPQCPEFYVALLAVLKASRAFCPLNLDTPADRLRFILQDVSAKLIITHSSYLSKLPPIDGVEVLLVDRNPNGDGNMIFIDHASARPESLAYVMYTSGSTGLPKAVSVTHQAVTQSLLAHDRHVPEFSRFLQFAAPTFDVSIFEIFFPWFRGRTVVGCTRQQLLDDLPDIIRKMEVDAAELTPTVAGNLLGRRTSVPGLKLLLTIGEMLTKHVIDEFGGDDTKPSILWAMYGPTEAAIHCTIQPSLQRGSATSNIGFPLDTVSAFVIVNGTSDQNLSTFELLPIGEVGELVIGGPQVAKEYHNRPELTASAFLNHPEYGYLYRTGDRARILPSGTIECLGRVSSGQVKLRGQRVELGEIENALCRLETCQSATVLVIEESIIAFCAVGSCEVSKSEVFNVCSRWLPGHMVPTDIMLLPRMPTVPSGKVDKTALKELYMSAQGWNGTLVQPLERADNPIIETLQTVLGRHISGNIDLPSAGLDSLRSIRVASLLREQGFSMSALDVLSVRTLDDLAKLCNDKIEDTPVQDVNVFGSFKTEVMAMSELSQYQAEISDAFPCTPIQEAMLAETWARSSAYCNWVEVELPMPLPFLEIRSYIQDIASKNEVLRSGFIATLSSDSQSFAQIVWRDLLEAQIIEVNQFTKSYSLGSPNSLLRPLLVQVNTAFHKPRVVIQMHHAIYDGWSLDLLLDDLNTSLFGKTLPARKQYRDFIQYYRQVDNEESRAYWTQQLHLYHRIPLPNYHGKVMEKIAVRRFSGTSSVHHGALLRHARKCAVHPQVFFQAAILYLISSYSGSTDVVIGTVTSGRTIPVTGVENIFGPCIASLPLRLDLSRISTVRDMLDLVHNRNREMLSHCTVPLRDIVRPLGLGPGTQLFDVLFVWQESLRSTDAEHSARIVDSADDLEFKITLEFEPHEDEITYRATFNTSTLPVEQIKYLCHQIDCLVHYFMQEADVALEMVGKCFSSPVLSIVNPNPVTKHFAHGPGHAVEYWAAHKPQKDALILGTVIGNDMVVKERLSYLSLNQNANKLARALKAYESNKDELICVLMDKSIDLYVAILAVIKLGCGYLPVVPDTPPERVRTILQEAKVKLCVSKRRYRDYFSGHNRYDVFYVDDAKLSELDDTNLDIAYDGSRLAYAVFTSGSTGAPKGVLVTQDNLMSNLDVLSDLYPVSEDSRLLQACSQAFDVSVFEIFFAWNVGICLCAATKDDLYHDLENSINSLGVTHLSLTPTVAGLVKPNRVPKVKFVVTAGEALNENVRRQWAGKGLFQGYGPSETTNICTVRSSFSDKDLINNIGPPFSNTSAFVMAPNSEEILPRGAVGELCFGGSQVFRGYLNRPELNKKKIIVHPEYGRLYRSGDLGIILPDNSILFVGRSDDQIKIRGQRVELGEITSTILDTSSAEDCATLLFDLPNSSQRLVSFWVPVKASSAGFQALPPNVYRNTLAAISQSITERLPRYMFPTHLVPISRIPVTQQTKIDKTLLRSTYDALSRAYLDSTSLSEINTDGDTLPESVCESKIAEALSQILRVARSDVRRTSSFYSLGLDSVSAIHLSTLLRQSGVASITVSAILKHSTVARLASYCASSASTAYSTNAITGNTSQGLAEDETSRILSEFRGRRIAISKILPCTPLQEAMLSSPSSGAGASYCNTMLFKVNGQVERLQDCWASMFRRHEILRTAFVPTHDPRFAFAQIVLESGNPVWDQLESDYSIDKYAERVLPRLLRGFEPPVQLAVIKTGEEIKLLFCCHHAIYDGTAMTTLMKEVQQAYLGYDLPSVIGYERYLRHMLSQDLEAADRFWTSSLDNFEPAFFPCLSGRTAMYESEESSLTYTHTIRTSLSKVLEAAQCLSVTLLPVIQATWAKLLQSYIGEDDFCFGNVVSGRSIPDEDLDRLVAPCFNTLPIRLRFPFNKSNANLIRHLHKLNVECLPFQLSSLRRIQARTKSSQGRLFDTLLILQQPYELLDHKIWILEKDTGTMDVPIVCEVSQDVQNDRLVLDLHYSSSFLAPQDAKVVVDTFDTYLSDCVQNPLSPANDTINLPPHLLAASNLDCSPFPSDDDTLLHASFERNAKLRPNSIALDFLHSGSERTTWTFKRMNEKANQIANTLIEHGLQVEEIVPIHIMKSPLFYASVLGILKAGGAFSPLHPDDPNARKQFILSELRPRIVLCTKDTLINSDVDVSFVRVDNLDEPKTENPSLRILRPTNLAYCLYTSGSTGTPKAVIMDHRAPVHTIESSRSLVPWTHDSRILQYAATTFDMCYYDCFLAWSCGFTICSASQSSLLDDVVRVINSLDVDLLDLTPSVAASIRRNDIPAVKWLYCIGEIMTPEIVKQWEGACVNSYGPTEAAFCTTMFPVHSESKVSIIGKPFRTASFAVFPTKGERILPIFAVGELYIGGAQLARGYLGRAELTEDKFVQRDGRRFYKTGDKVRMLSHGDFEFIGRSDDQVKIRGLRVELGEINQVIQDCDKKIKGVTTQIMRRDIRDKDQLVAFVALSDNEKKNENAALQRKAKQASMDKLPPYMVPQFFLLVNKIPVSSAGKADKKALFEIFRTSEDSNSGADSTAELLASHNWTEVENHVREILARLSRIELSEIHATTSIYQLGLDSINAVQIAAALRSAGFHLSTVDILKYPNCLELSAFIERSKGVDEIRPLPFDFHAFESTFRPQILSAYRLHDEAVECIRPCTPMQEGIVSQFISTEGAVYFNYLRMRIASTADKQKLKAAWLSVMQRHAVLRTGFTSVTDTRHPFAMIQYATNVCSLPWREEVQPPSSVEAWLHRSKSQALKQLHKPPWSMRVVEECGQWFLDLAILHALFDARSLQIVFDEVASVYNGVLPGLPMSPDIALGTILSLSKQSEDRQMSFWKEYGKGAVPTRFPGMAPLRVKPEPAALLSKICSKPLSQLEAGCRALNISLQAAGLAAWTSILAAYIGETSVTCGIVLSGRTFEAAESAVFPCLVTLPFVCEVSSDADKMAAEIMRTTANILANQFTPLSKIQSSMGYSNETLFDTLFAFQKQPNDQIKHPLWTVVEERATTDYPISIELEPEGDRLELRITYLPHIIPQPQAILILDQLDHLIEHFVLRTPSLFKIDQSNALLYSITPAKEPSLPSKANLLHETVEISAIKRPDSVALEFATSIRNGRYRSKSWTYRELDGEGNRIAHLIVSLGVKPGELIAVCFDKCAEASFAMLGILKAGCAFVALDPESPMQRKRFIVQDSKAKLVLSTTECARGLSDATAATIVNLDIGDWRSLSPMRPNLERNIDAQDCSYCLYTSGTTGTPKGCEITHENAVQALAAFERLFTGHWDDNSRWLQFASFHFDVSVLEQYWSWLVGIRVISAPRDVIFQDLATSIRVLEITHVDLTPSLAQLLHPNDVQSLCKGVFITGGESLKQEILDAWGPKHVIYNGYGPTEATIGVTMYPRVPENGRPSNIGPQFDNVGSFVLKPGSEEPVLRGGIGELCVSGKLVGKGYLNRPELTQERFPYLSRFKERVYRTGDLVRILHDGSFDFIGRADDQVKLRGQRLEIGEINSIIRTSTKHISDVATLVVKHPQQRKDQLVSFVVTDATPRTSPKLVLEFSDDLQNAKNACIEKLPGYMVPTHFLLLTSLPLSANNKVDAKRLKDMYSNISTSDLQRLSGAPVRQHVKWSAVEQRIRKVLSDLLQLDEAGVDKDFSFFQLGLDSISAIAFTRALKDAGISEVAASDIIKFPSISGLARTLSKDGKANNDQGSVIAAQQHMNAFQHRHRRVVAEALALDAREIEYLVPCTPLQQGMIAKSLDSEEGLYFNTFHFKINRDIDEEKLREAWYAAYRVMPILRTVFANTEDGYAQAIRRKGLFPWASSSKPKNKTIETHLNELRQMWIQKDQHLLRRPFELVLVSSSDKKVLAIHIFHALYDGISIELIFDTVWNLYLGKWKAKTVPAFHTALVHGPLRPQPGAKDFWTKQLSKKSIQPLPSFTQNPKASTVTITRELRNLYGYESTRRQLNVTSQAIAQACWARIIHGRTKGVVGIGLVVSGRNIDLDDAEHIIGPMFNTIPYEYRPRSEESWSAFIKRTHDFNVATYDYQHTPLRDIMKWCTRGPNQPLFDNLFVFQVADVDQEWRSNEVWTMLDPASQADYPLAFEVEQFEGESLRLTIVSQGHIADDQVASGMLDEFEDALHTILREPETLLESQSTGEELARTTDPITDEHVKSTDADELSNFSWTRAAMVLRQQIAELANIDSESIKAHTSIFELGLDSIDAIKLSSRLKKSGININVSSIMRKPSIARMMPGIPDNNKNWTQQPSSMIYDYHKRRLWTYLQSRALFRDEIEAILPLTPLQESMVAEMQSSDYKRYYNHDVLKLKPETDMRKLKDAWVQVVSQSPILRTSFLEIDDPGINFTFAQVVHRSLHDFWKDIDIEGNIDFTVLIDNIRQSTAAFGRSGPLFSIHTVKVDAADYLVLSIAHLLYDGWSLQLLHSDVRRAYFGHIKPRPSYDIVLRNILTAAGSDAVAFWRDFLTDATIVPFARRLNATATSRNLVHREEYSSNLHLTEITTFAKANNLTLQTLGQTTYALTLASYVKSLDVTFGSVLSGRDDDNLAEIMFPTMNTVAIRAILHGTRKELLHYVQENFSHIKQWQHFPLRKAQAFANVQGNLFESLFIYQKRVEASDREEMKLYESVDGHSDVEYPVCVEMELVDGKLLWRCAVKDEVFDATGARRLLRRLDEVMKHIVENVGAPTVDISAEGTSICGLPPFKNRKSEEPNEKQDNDEEVTEENLNTEPAKTIREVLAYVSKTPAEEILNGMTLFHIGLDSISAIKVSSLLRKRNIFLSVGEMLKAGTVERMAQVADEQSPGIGHEEGDADAVLEEALHNIDQSNIVRRRGIGKEKIERILPATAGQVYVLSMWLNTAGASFYPEFRYHVGATMSFDLLRQAWREVVSANQILRTIFVSTQDQSIPYLQVILRATEVAITNVSGMEEQDMDSMIVEQASKQPFVHLFVAQTSDGWNLKLKIHHALYDGVSLPLLLQNFEVCCSTSKRTSKRPMSADIFSGFLATNYTSSAVNSRKMFWTNYLSGIKQYRLPQPISIPTTRVESFRSSVLAIDVLDGLTRSRGVTTQSLFLGAFAKIYASLTSTPNGQDVVIGIYLANRSHIITNIDQATIPTVNLVPLRVTAPLDVDIVDVASQIQYDLQEISSPVNSGVHLSEVDGWTGIKIDCFVNFLKLPQTKDDSTVNKQIVSITQIGNWDEDINRVTDLQVSRFTPDEGLVNSEVMASYLHAIDIEATVRNGALDVGVFAPGDMLALDDAEILIRDIKSELQKLAVDGRELS